MRCGELKAVNHVHFTADLCKKCFTTMDEAGVEVSVSPIIPTMPQRNAFTGCSICLADEGTFHADNCPLSGK